jgi:crotonobetainyl-CoA:carnitine CoA-transferase CaiB-like acyl-CoA transferase
MVACLYNQGANYLVGGTAPTRFGNAHPNLVPYQSFETADGSIALGVGNDDQFRRLCDVLGVGDLARHAAYATNSQRLAHRHELVGKLATVLHTRTTVEWQALLLSHHLPVGPIHTIPQALGHPQVRHRDMVEEASGPAAPAMIKSPIHMKGLDRGIRRLPAALGEHTEEILADILQYAPDQIAGLRSSGAI